MDKWHHLCLILGQVGALEMYHAMCDGVDYHTNATVARLDTGLDYEWLEPKWERALLKAQRAAARSNGCKS